LNKNNYLIDLAESARTDFGRVDFSKQSDAQKVFSAIWELESEVNNGGFLQYFGNSSGETANYAPSALRQIGAARCAAIVEQAVRTVSPEPLPDSRNEREVILDSLAEMERAKLADLDAKFFAYPDNLTELLFEYVRVHPEAFGPIP
jgi:hypothetical protein